MGLSPLFVTHELEPYDLPLTCLGSVEAVGIRSRNARSITLAARPNPRHRIQVTNKGHTVSPGKWLAKMEEPAARAIVRKCGELRACLSALANFHCRVWAAHLSLHPAGMRGVHFNFAVAQFVG